jgi:transcriptional regulator with XRE-family HTH domain
MGKIRENVQKNLNSYLELRKMSRKELAQKLNVSPSAVTNWTTGKNSPDIEAVAKICKILKITVNDLFGIKDKANTLDELEKQMIDEFRSMTTSEQKIALRTFGIDVSHTNTALLYQPKTKLSRVAEPNSQYGMGDTP